MALIKHETLMLNYSSIYDDRRGSNLKKREEKERNVVGSKPRKIIFFSIFLSFSCVVCVCVALTYSYV